MMILARERKSIDAQIEELDAKIEKAAERVKNLKAQRQELLSKKENVAMQEIYSIISEKGISASQAAEILRNVNM